jgi:predicted RNase H-like HicB family nuclease
MNIKVLVEPGEDGYFVAHVPSLKSCWSQGKTKEEALENIREAIDLYLEPEPTELTEDQELIELTVWLPLLSGGPSLSRIDAPGLCRSSP